MTTNTFNAGDKVLVYHDHHDTKPATATVIRTTSRTVTLEDGQKFGADGAEWGKGSAWFHKRIEKVK